MNSSRFVNIFAVVLTSCCYWNVVSSEEVERNFSPISSGSASGENVFKRLGQRNHLTHQRESSEKDRCPAKKLNPSPTIKPVHPFDPHADATRLYKAMKGGGTDEQTIIDILTHRNYVQRDKIAVVFTWKYRYDFREWLFGEISAFFEVIIFGLMYHPTQVLAEHLLWAVKGAGTDEQTLIDILVPMTTTEKTQVKSAFKAKSGYSLRYYVKDDTQDAEFQDLLLALIDTNRPDDGCVNVAQAKKDAATLRQLESRASSVHYILASRSWVQLKETFKIYENKYSIKFDPDIPNGWYKEAISAIYQHAMDANTFFAKALERDVFWCQTQYWDNDYGVARVFTWRAEIDLGDISKAYYSVKKWRETLVENVKILVNGYAENTLIGILQ